MKPKCHNHLLLPILGATSAGIIALLVAGLVGFSTVELVLPLAGGAFGHFLNTI